jgi:CheY-like chemotaxis protein
LERANIVQIVMNLVLNARDTILEKMARGVPADWVPRVTVTTALAETARRRDGASAVPFASACAVLTVADNGLGIPAELKARVFEPFFTTKGPGQGTGLGLAVVWNVVHSLGGWIEFEAEAHGGGTCFKVYLPVPETPGAIAELPPTVAGAEFALGRRSARPLRILLAEDNPLVTETFAALLGAAGHVVTAAQDGAEAWEIFLRRGAGAGFELVLADFNMPRLNGAELLQRVKTTGFAGRFVVVSGYLENERLEELKRSGADEVIRKPVTPSKLLAAVEGDAPAERRE